MPVVRISEELFKEVQKYAVPLVDNFETALWKALRANEKHPDNSIRLIIPQIKIKKPKSFARGELTSSADIWKLILQALVEKGGKAPRQEVHDIIKRKLEGTFKSGDNETNRDGTLKWEKHVDYQRLAMAHDGLLKNDSPRGIWEISERGRNFLLRFKAE